MNSSANHANRKTCVILPGACTLKEAGSIKELLRDALEANGDVELDGRGVDRVDTSVLQLVASFSRDMKEAGRASTWVGTSEEFNRSTQLLGLASALGVGGRD